MTQAPVYIAAAGIVGPLGRGLAETERMLRLNRSAIEPLHIFSLLQGDPLPVGQVAGEDSRLLPPRTHRLAREAALMALQDCPEPPDAVVLGCTTGGILTTEQLLRDGVDDKQMYRYHGLASVAEDIAELCNCFGPAITVSTACSSSATAIALAMSMLRQGGMRRILAGGVDSLCRLTYFGFHSLQLVDRQGCRPLDASRQGLAVAEGAGMLLLTTERPQNPLAVLLGAGLSCDAYHATAPHPEGKGAIKAMQAALSDAGIATSAIDYINLHGTGTPDNDSAEAKAVAVLFQEPPPVSSIKGAMGHSLAAAGAIEAIVSSLAIRRGFLPANTGCRQPDPALALTPLVAPVDRPVRIALSNSFGFGGNNGCLIIGRPDQAGSAIDSRRIGKPLAVHGVSCLTGAGLTEATLARLAAGKVVAGKVADDVFGRHLPPRMIRRMKRLSRLSLLLAAAAHGDTGGKDKPASVFMGTGWGALSETYDFLKRLNDSGEQYPSPTDFVGSVHNGPASQIAILFNAVGTNITASGGDFSFEQALLAADHLVEEDGQSALLLGADEGHEPLSFLLDSSIEAGSLLADGGGAFYINRNPSGARCVMRPQLYCRDGEDDPVGRLVESLGGTDRIRNEYAAVFAGIPAEMGERGNRRLSGFLQRVGTPFPVCRFRRFTGEFASASAVAAVLAVSCLEKGVVPGALVDNDDVRLQPGQKLLLLGTGRFLSAVEFFRP